MSSPKLAKFLTKLHNELQKSSDDYRTAVSNKRTHVFTYKGSRIKQTIRDLLYRSSGGSAEGRQALKEIEPELAKLITKLTTEIRKKFASLHDPSKGIRVAGIRGGVTAIVQEFEGSKGGRDNYAKISGAYKPALDKFYEDFLNVLGKPLTRPSSSKPGQVRNISTAGQAFNLEHEGSSSNIEEFLNNGIHEALNTAYGDSSLTPALKKELKNLGLEAVLKIYKKSKDGKLDVVLGSQILNAIQGGGREKQLAADLRKALEAAMADIANLKGSDSLVEGQRKKAVKVVTDPFKSKKTLKTSVENTKIVDGGPVTKKFKTKNTSGQKRGDVIRKRRVATKQKSKDMASMFNIMAMINQKLPETVAKNMKAPGLENRTGNFANSVRLVDALVTRKGFPSLGYTYDKSPYQVFEMGAGRAPWATPERDPRVVIDASIRELAAQMAIGRFYTRRV